MGHQISIESLSLCNFGPFYGSKEIDFRTDKKAPPSRSYWRREWSRKNARSPCSIPCGGRSGRSC